MPPPTLPVVTPTQALKDAKKRKTQADKALVAAGDLIKRAADTTAGANETYDRALAEKIAADQAFDAAVQNFRDAPDEP